MKQGSIYYGRAPEAKGPRAEGYRLGLSGKRRCISCKLVRTLRAFSKRNAGRYYKSTCKTCDAARFTNWNHAIPGRGGARTRAYYQARKEQRWQEVLNALGRECACCGEDELDFLTVDHIHRDGYKDRHSGGRTLWSKIRREGYPKDRYQILCYCCNMGRERRGDGICPHQRKKLRLVSGE